MNQLVAKVLVRPLLIQKYLITAALTRAPNQQCQPNCFQNFVALLLLISGIFLAQNKTPHVAENYQIFFLARNLYHTYTYFPKTYEQHSCDLPTACAKTQIFPEVGQAAKLRNLAQ